MIADGATRAPAGAKEPCRGAAARVQSSVRMRPSSDADAPAFRYLRRRLVRCRLAQLDFRLRVELLVIGLLLTAFVFWQVRAPLASLRLHGGPATALAAVGGLWALLAILTGGTAAVRLIRQMQTPPGPAWLALPVSGAEFGKHMAWESSLLALWVAVPAVGIWVAALGPAPWIVMIALLPVLVGVLWQSARAGAAIARWWITRRIGGASDMIRHLATSAPLSRSTHRPPARWRRLPAWLAL